MKRRTVLTALCLTPLARAHAQQASRAEMRAELDALVRATSKGAPVREGRVKLDLPVLADSGNAVPLTVSVESPMTEADHVRAIHLLSERNPVRNMATFHFGPRSGRAQVISRVRLGGTQRVVALAEMSDGSFWSAHADVVVTVSACIDEI